MKTTKKTVAQAACGSLVGAANGLFGGGGGMIAVPLLISVTGLPDKSAHATAIYIIAPISAASAVIYAARGFALPKLFIPVSLGAIAGGMLGALLLNKLPKKAVNYIFIAVMLAAGIRMLIG